MIDAIKRLLRMIKNLFVRRKNETGAGPSQEDKHVESGIQEFKVLSCDVVSIVEIEKETN